MSSKYFHGYISENDALYKLKRPNEFLLRFSSHLGLFSLSTLTPPYTVQHARIKRENGKFYFGGSEYYSLQALVEEKKAQGMIPVECDTFNDLFKSKSSNSVYLISNYHFFVNDD